jgi:hypothetical protein
MVHTFLLISLVKKHWWCPSYKRMFPLQFKTKPSFRWMLDFRVLCLIFHFFQTTHLSIYGGWEMR